MPDHISPALLVIALAINFLFRFVLLTVFLLIMIKIQKLEFTWLPLIGSALLASALDMIPLVGHFIAVPVLYLCIWKISHGERYDAVFTVGLSYALVRCAGFILLAFAPMPAHLHPASAADDDGMTNVEQMVVAQPAVPSTNQIAQVAQVAQTAPDPQEPPAPDDKISSGISIKGVSGGVNSAMVTIQYGRKDYILSQDEGVTLSTDEGMVPVHLLKADENNVTLSVNGQEVKYVVR
jgi:hypothetical protein